MASEEDSSSESYPMSSGDGPHSYFNHSTRQSMVAETAKEMINKAIQGKLELDNLPNTFHIADFGCSTGPNTFIAMQNIVEALELKYKNNPSLEFQVFFNDHKNNDFNTLFHKLPHSRNFFAAGVPGSFHGRLFPESYLHFGYSSFALHWLSKVPKEVGDAKSPAWNKDSIHCRGYDKQVARAYSTQFNKDIETFLNARAQELVNGGLMVIVIPALSDGSVCSQTVFGLNYDLLGSSLMDMAKMGLISQEKVEAFNLPVYHPSVKELKTLLESNKCFKIEGIDAVNIHTTGIASVEILKSLMRAIMEELITQHFGSEIVDSVFNCFAEKLSANYSTYVKMGKKSNYIFVLLKRK